MTSEVDIANAALIKLGEPVVTAITGTGLNKPARTMGARYEPLRDHELRTHLWNFAAAEAKLAQLSAAPVIGYTYAYQLPTDFLRVAAVYSNAAGLGTIPYKIVGSTIQCDASAVWLRYVRKVTVVNEMTPDFREVLSALLAADTAIAITQSASLRDANFGLYNRLVGIARSTDAIEDWPEEIPPGSWITERFRGSSGSSELL